jgi:hypothetical protein
MSAGVWLRILTVLVVLFCLANYISVQHDLNDRKEQIRQDLQQISSVSS